MRKQVVGLYYIYHALSPENKKVFDEAYTQVVKKSKSHLKPKIR